MANQKRDELKKALDYLRRKDPENEVLQSYDRRFGNLTTSSEKTTYGSVSHYDHWKQNYSREGIKEKQRKSKKSVTDLNGVVKSKGYDKEMEKRKKNPYEYVNQDTVNRLAKQKELEEKKAKQQKREQKIDDFKNMFSDNPNKDNQKRKENLNKAMDILGKVTEPFDRVWNTVSSSIKEGVENRTLNPIENVKHMIHGAKEGALGRSHVSGKELNRVVGFNPEEGKIDNVLAQLAGKATVDLIPGGRILSPYLDKKASAKLGDSALGMATETVLDPLNVTEIGVAAKIISMMNKGKSVKQVAKELNVAEEVVQREFIRGTLPGQELVDIVPNEFRLPEPKPEIRFNREIGGPTMEPKSSEPLGLNEPLYRHSVDGLGKEVKINGTPQLNAPRFDRAVQSSELPDIESSLNSIFKRRQEEEDLFVRSEMAPYDDMLKRSAEADMAWNDSVKKSKEIAENIKKNYGKISIPEGNWADWGKEVPAQFRANRGTNTSGIDIYTFADNEGFSSVDEAVQFLKNIDAESKTKLKDLKPADDMKIKPEDYDALEQAARLKFQQTDTAKGLDGTFEELNAMLKSGNETAATGDPLSFMQSKMFKTKKEPISFTGRMNPKDTSAVRSEGSYSTRYKETPTGDTLEIHPEKPIEFKTTQETTRTRQPVEERGQASRPLNRDKVPKGWDSKGLFPGEFGSNSFDIPESKPQNKSSFTGVENQKPLGVKAGTVDEYANSPIAAPETFSSQVKSGKKSLAKLSQWVKTQIGSDTQPFYDAEKTIAKANGVNADDLLPDGTFKAKKSLYKGLRGVRRATKMALHSIDKDYQPIFNNLEKAGIKRLEFEEYALAKHSADIMAANEGKLKRNGDIHARLQEIEQLIQVTTDKKAIVALKKEEGKLLNEQKNLEPYELGDKVTPEFVANTLARWNNHPEMVKAQKDFIKEQRKDMQLLVKAGRFSQAEVDEIFKKHPNYISMRRQKDDYEVDLRIGQKRDKGSSEDIMSPIDSAIMNRVLSYQGAMENMAKQKIVGLAKAKGGEKFFWELDPQTMATLSKSDRENKLKNSIKFYVDGKEKYYETPTALKNAYDNLKLGKADTLATKVFSSLADITRKGATGYNLDFIVKSIPRESQAPLLTSRTNVHPGELILGFLDSFIGKDLEKLSGGKFKSYQEIYKQLGGHSSGFITMNYTSVNKVTKGMKKGKAGQLADKLNPIKGIERFGAAVEHAPKLAEYRSAKNKGYDDEDAIFEAMDVFDHADAGTAVRGPNKGVAYLNAAIRGNTRILEAAKANPGQFLAKGAMYVTLPTLGIYAMRFAPGVSEEQRIRLRDKAEWQKNMNWYVPLPDGETIVPVPKAHLIAQMFANPVERVLDKVFDDSGKSWEELGKDTTVDVLKSFIPPTGIAGLSQLQAIAANQDPFTKMPIEDADMEREPDPTKRYNVYTSEVAKGIGNATNSSPAKIDYFMKSMTGGVGRDVLDTIDNTLANTKKKNEQGQEEYRRPSKVNSIPQILNPLDQFVDDKTQGSGTYGRLYEEQKKGNKAVKGYYDAIYDLNKIVKEVRESKTMSPGQKRERIEEIREQQRAIGDKALKSGALKKQ